ADTARAEQGKLGAEVGKLKGKLKGGTSPELEALLAKAGELKAAYDARAAEQAEAEQKANALMLQLPAVPDPAWPVGADAAENVVVRQWNSPGREPKPLGDGQLDHIALGEKLGIIDFGRGVKLAGSRAYVMRGAGAQLYNAVLRLALDTLVARGWELFTVPVLVTEQCMVGTGYFPAGRDQAYVTQDGNVLVGTSEVPLASFYGDEIADEATLPRRMCAVSTCFRREAGAAGRDTAGLYRVHQFDKVEQVVIHAADEAEHVAIHEEIIANSEHLLQQLGLAYRVVQNCTGDMGQGKWRMYDIETWMPSRKDYGETHSGSALRDFQSRRLNLRYRKKGEKSPTFAYTLNNTAIACPRALIAILETYQNADGTVTVPDAL
ncbi:serine--tRNA ligase, partial [bacterium]